MRRLACALFLGLLLAGSVHGRAKKIDDFNWENVDRVVAIGDLHGDYEQYMKVMRDAGLVNSRGRWSGGRSHLVQTGDIPDRGAATRAIIDHLAGLKKQAARKGGRVHTLIGNHEAMNSYGDLRYVTDGEFQAFLGPRSAEYQQRQWEHTLQRYKTLKPEEFLLLDQAVYRKEWEQQYPLGWVEHRSAWLPEGEYGQWIMGNPVAIRINDTLFVHGGLGPAYCRYSLEELTQQAHKALRNHQESVVDILNDPEGPLWYRGLAMDEEAELEDLVDAMLQRYGARRIVVGHTPTGGVVWPRFDGRVVVNDTGIAGYYGGNDAFLELGKDGPMAGYGDLMLKLPERAEDRIEYLAEVIRFRPGNEVLERRMARLTAPSEPEPLAPLAETVSETTGPVMEAVSPGICQ